MVELLEERYRLLVKAALMPPLPPSPPAPHLCENKGSHHHHHRLGLRECHIKVCHSC